MHTGPCRPVILTQQGILVDYTDSIFWKEFREFLINFFLMYMHLYQELIHIEIKELNKRIKDKGVSKELACRLKQRRRTLKNRKYATR